MNQISISCMVLKSLPMAHCGQTRTFICVAHLAPATHFALRKLLGKWLQAQCGFANPLTLIA